MLKAGNLSEHGNIQAGDIPFLTDSEYYEKEKCVTCGHFESEHVTRYGCMRTVEKISSFEGRMCKCQENF